MLTVEYGHDALPILVLVVVWVFAWVAVNVIFWSASRTRQ